VRLIHENVRNFLLISASVRGASYGRGLPLCFFTLLLIVCGSIRCSHHEPAYATSSLAPNDPEQKTCEMYGVEIVDIMEHDPGAFTQGITFWEGDLFEGTGRRGQSTLKRRDLDTGEVLTAIRLSDLYFGEGVTVFKGTVYQLTWKSGLCLTYDAKDLRPLKSFSYEGEGWGLTHDGQYLIMSDGSSQLRFMTPDTFEEKRRLTVKCQGQAVSGLNELEYVDGMIYANIWCSDSILIIDPDSGRAVGKIDLGGLLKRGGLEESKSDVLNGIAFDERGNRLFVTGKCWPALFQVRLIRQ